MIGGKCSRLPLLIALALAACLFAVDAPGRARHHVKSAHHHAAALSTKDTRDNTSSVRTDGKPTEDLRQAMALAHQGDWKALRALAVRTPDTTVATLARWFYLSNEASNASFDELDAFLRSNPDWPRQTAIQSFAEKRMPQALDARAVLAWFQGRQPETGIGAVRLGEAELATGEHQRGADRIRRAWVTNSFDRTSEGEILAAHGNLLTRDVQDARLAHLLYGSDDAALRRQMARASHQAVQKATIRALLQKSPKKGLAEYAALPGGLKNDPDVMFDAARATRALGRTAEARHLLLQTARSDESVPASLWWPELIASTREALKEHSYTEAYDLVSRHHLEPGQDFADAEFVAGWIALKYLAKPDLALHHFQTLAQNVSRPISVARAHYWMGRALDGLKRNKEAKAQYEIAARKPDTFYGQLALTRVEPHPVLPLEPKHPIASTTDALAKDSRAKAFRYLAAAGARDLAREFGTRIAKDDLDEAKAAALIRLAKETGDPALPLKLAKLAEYQDVIVDDALHPTTIPGVASDSEPIPKAELLAFVRQESEFDTGAVSSAGARGLMQMMPAVAKQRAKSLGLPYSEAKLTSDPQYNIRLGTMHFRAFYQAWRGSYVLAIASYNAGAGNVRKWVEAFGDPRNPSIDPIDWIEAIPFAETRNYVQRVIENIQVYRSRLGGRGQPLEIAKMLTQSNVAVAQNDAPRLIKASEVRLVQPSEIRLEAKHHIHHARKSRRHRTMTAELR